MKVNLHALFDVPFCNHYRVLVNALRSPNEVNDQHKSGALCASALRHSMAGNQGDAPAMLKLVLRPRAVRSEEKAIMKRCVLAKLEQIELVSRARQRVPRPWPGVMDLGRMTQGMYLSPFIIARICDSAPAKPRALPTNIAMTFLDRRVRRHAHSLLLPRNS